MWSDLNSNIGKITALISAISFVASTSHELGFFLIVGFGFIHLLSIADYLNVAVTWLPLAIAMFLAGTIMNILLNRSEGYMSEEELVATSPAPRFTKWFRLSGEFVQIFVFPVMFTAMFLFTPEGWWLIGMLPAIVIWLTLSLWVSRHPRSPFYEDQGRHQLFMYAPLIPIVSFIHGVDHGYEAKTIAEAEYDLGGKKVEVIRAIDRGLIYRDGEEFVFTTWAGVGSFKRGFVEPQMTFKSCIWFGWGCPSEPVEEQPEPPLGQ